MKNVYPFKCQEDVLAEARTWVLKFNGDTPVTDVDIVALREWTLRSANHRAELERAETFWCDADLLSALAVVHHAPSGNKASVGRIAKLMGFLTGFNRVGALAAVVFVTVAIALSFRMLPLSETIDNGTYHTLVGEQKILKLADKSQIQLDTNSKLRVEYSAERRQVYLLEGKAYFDVAKNSGRPFEVYAGDGIVRAIGTAFSVYLTDRDVKVTVDEGRVNLTRVEQQAVVVREAVTGEKIDASISGGDVFLSLEKGQSALFNDKDEVLRELADRELSNDIAWRKGLLIFNGEPLSEVILEISRYTPITIEIADPALSDLMIGGRFRTGELEALLDVLKVGFGVHVSYVGEDHIQLRAFPR